MLLSLTLAIPSFFCLALDEAQDLVVREWLVSEAVDGRGRRPFRPDAVFKHHLLNPSEPAPRSGEALVGEYGSANWVPASADENGSMQVDGNFAWAYAKVELDSAQVMLADLQGASTLFVNGDGFVGDAYRFGHQGVPVSLKKGVNHVFVTGTRGNFKLVFHQRRNKLVFADWASTTPHLLTSGQVGGEASIALMNLSDERIPLLYVVAGGVGPFKRSRSLITWGLEPLGLTRVPVSLIARDGHPLPDEAETQKLYLSLGGANNEDPQVEWLNIGMKNPHQAQLRTFRSSIDNTVQQFGLVPPQENPQMEGERGLVMSLHGASVGPMNQANCFAPKEEWWIACPTNRSPYGFDWQDWGRLDAYEVRDLMLEMYELPPQKVALTGHSMGGHGTWHLAVNDPDAWCAVAPSAGWCSFDTYGSRPEGELRETWHAADGASDTLGLLQNLKGKPLYILHGDADETVPASEAREMASACDERGIDYQMHLEEGAGHWWGNQCMDWPGIFETFADKSIPQSPLQLDFTTAGIGIDSTHHWLTIVQAIDYGKKSKISAWRSKDASSVSITTENISYLKVNLPLKKISIDLQEMDNLEVGPHGLWFARDAKSGKWEVRHGSPPASEKNPNRVGPFKRAFENSFVLVYGSNGSATETAELLARARYDSEVWFYRANGHARICSDREFLDPEHQEDFSDRNVILYGNQINNSAWHELMPEDSPLRVSNHELQLGDKKWQGQDLAATVVLPRKGEHHSLVAAFASTGVPAIRLGYTLAPFISGVGYPDYTVFDAKILTDGDGGVLEAGWWGNDWGLVKEEM